MSAPNPPPPDQPGSSGGSNNGQAPPLFSMNFFVPLNPSASGQPPGEGQPQASVTWTMSFSTQPPPGHPPTAQPGANPIPPVGINLPPHGGPVPAIGIPGLFPPFNIPGFFGMQAEPQPDPEKAKELLRSLPSVSDGIMRRINRLCDADEADADVKGWRCGVCMEGVDEERIEDGTGVKALPCNHLFHESCLEPWFATKHTCPACRLDLDPLRTMGSANNNHAGGRVPRPPRQVFHPFRRDAIPLPPQSGPAPPAAPSTDTASATEMPAPSNGDDLIDVESSFSFTFRIPTPPPASAGSNQGGQPPATPQASQPATTSPMPAAVPMPMPFFPNPASLMPNMGMLGQRIHNSPSPMAPTRQTTPPIPAAPPTASITSGSNIVPGAFPLPMPVMPLGPALPPGSQPHQGHPHLHAPQPRRPQVVVHHNHPPPAPGHPPPPFVPANFHPPMVPPQIIHVFHGGPPPIRPAAPSPNAGKRLVAKPLEDWVKEKEREKGWRHDCDAPLCEFAPTAADTQSIEQEKAEEPPLEPLLGNAQDDSIAKPACTHRYHAGCLETMERSAGRWNIQGDGKVFVRCARCKKDGWVQARDGEEEEVDRGLVEA